MWYVLQVAAGREDSICEKCKKAFLGKEASQIFVPKYVWLKKVKGVRQKEVNPLFSGYLFVESKMPETLEKRLQILQGVKPVCIGGGFYPIREEEEDFLRQFWGEERIVHFSTGYIVDRELNVIDGALKNFPKKVRRIDRHNRLAEIELSLFGQQRRVLVGLEVKAKLTKEEFEKGKKVVDMCCNTGSCNTGIKKNEI
ncbi:MAG: antiterminator LoaP [Lachnospiraceae bacterium]